MSECTYICGKCEVEAHGSKTMPPPDWRSLKIQGQAERLLCPDCATVHRFSASSEVTINTPTPIRMTGKPDMATSILLRSGVYLDLACPDFTIVRDIDIAAGLRQFRFSAQTPQPYTIAQHCCLVLDLVRPIHDSYCGQNYRGRRGDALLWAALMHDALEAFFHDITRPLKGQLPDYRLLEHRYTTMMFDAFSVSTDRDIKKIVKIADIQALAIEQRDVCGNNDPWPATVRVRAEGLPLRIDRIWSPDEAEARFLEAFHAHRPEPKRIAA